MIFARAMAIACLTVMKVMCWFVGALLVVLTLTQFVRGEVDAKPVVTVVSAAVFVVLGFVAGWGSRRFAGAAE